MCSAPSTTFISTPSAASLTSPDRKSFAAVVDRKSDTGLGRGVGVADFGFRKGGAQRVKHRLIGDFSREANVGRCKSDYVPTH